MKITENGGAAYDRWTAGRLNPAYYKDYAEYFVRWILAMEQRGYPVYAVTLQNEPLNRGNSMSPIAPRCSAPGPYALAPRALPPPD